MSSGFIIPIAKVEDVWLKEWRRYRPGFIKEKRTASISCPSCGHVSSLSTHQIDETGKVSPSVVCPNDDCDWHTFVRLEDWENIQ